MRRGLGIVLLGSYLLLVAINPVVSWGSSNNKDRVLLKDINALTLRAGEMTNGRRSNPVPQLKCVGGTAGYSAPQPKVVQCLNRGSDGYDVQWECQADMEYDYRFGRVQVSCEGYDNPDDPYILRGSCGLEYELDLTGQGRDRGYESNHGGYGNNHGHQGSYNNYNSNVGVSWGKIISLIILGTIIYCVYKCFVGGGQRYTPTATPTSSSTYSSTAGANSGNTGAGGGGGGWWSGAATGGLLGYMFGNRGNGGYGRGWGSSWGGGYTGRNYRSSGWSSGGSGWGSGGGSWGGSSSSSSSSRRSGSRTTSGFGGTSRR